MFFWPTNIFSKPSILNGFKFLFAASTLTMLANSAHSQGSRGVNPDSTANAVTCYKSAIKEPLTFYGNPMDTFTLYDGTRWKVSNSGAYEYIPLRYRNILICPSEELLVVDKRAISVSKINQ
jgi:hypothetical protein